MTQTNYTSNAFDLNNFNYDNDPRHFLTANDPDAYYQYRVNYSAVFRTQAFRDNWKHTVRFSRTNMPFNNKEYYPRLNSAQYQGYLMKTVKAVQPTTREIWEVEYGRARANYMLQQGHQHEAYLFANMLDKFVESVYNKTGMRLSWREAMLDVFIYVIDNTWMGYNSEHKGFKDMYRYLWNHTDKLVRVDHTTAKDDDGRSIDALISVSYDGKNYQVVAGVQLKPQSYFASKDWTSITRQDNLKNNVKFFNERHVPVLYWTYEDLAKGVDPMMLIDSNGGVHEDFPRVTLNY